MGLSEEFLFNGDFGVHINESGPADLLALLPVHSAEGAIAGEYLSHGITHRPELKLMTDSTTKKLFQKSLETSLCSSFRVYL